MATLYRRDEGVQDAMGNPISGVQIAVATQPANTSSFPPPPAVQLYSDSAGADPLYVVYVAPQTDGYGMASYYLLPGIYTVCYMSSQIAAPGQQIVLTDQIVNQPFNSLVPQYNSESTADGTLGSAGFGGIYTLSATPSPVNSLVVAVNGIVQTGWSFAAPRTITLAVVPQAQDVVTAVYQIA
jgi:hypothetical protein